MLCVVVGSLVCLCPFAPLVFSVAGRAELETQRLAQMSTLQRHPAPLENPRRPHRDGASIGALRPAGMHTILLADTDTDLASLHPRVSDAEACPATHIGRRGSVGGCSGVSGARVDAALLAIAVPSPTPKMQHVFVVDSLCRGDGAKLLREGTPGHPPTFGAASLSTYIVSAQGRSPACGLNTG